MQTSHRKTQGIAEAPHSAEADHGTNFPSLQAKIGTAGMS